MMLADLIHVSGVALLLAGVIWAVTSILHPNNHDPKAFQDRFWVSALAGQGVSYWLGVLGLVGLYVRQAEQSGILGLVGFVLAILGSAITITVNMDMAFLLPSVAAQQAKPTTVMQLLGPSSPLPWLARITLMYLLLFVPGYILIGIVTISAGVLPGPAGWLLIIGTIVSNIGAPIAKLFILRRVGGVVFGVGLAWLGLALLA